MNSRTEIDISGNFNAMPDEDEAYLTEQLITYIGNKRTLLDFIGNGLNIIQKRLNKSGIDSFDVFSGSGIVSRYLKRYSQKLIANDIENYSYIINKCYLANGSSIDHRELNYWFELISEKLSDNRLESGFITELYAPNNPEEIRTSDRCFYTKRNAMYLDTARKHLESVPEHIFYYLMGPLLSEASVHANTSGVFKGFYKNSKTGAGQFGGNDKNALTRILGDIQLKMPLFSRFDSDVKLYKGDANYIAEIADEVDIAYIDPPYNQHPYGSNYFMLNLIADYQRPSDISDISGIPKDWNRSDYNKKHKSYNALYDLADKLNAKYLMISFNSEGFISHAEMMNLLKKIGKTQVLETRYNTFRGSRNLENRNTHLKEYLFLTEKY